MKEKLLHMRDKLNDISRRNRSIRLLKLYNKWSFDLTELDTLSKLSKEKLSQSIVEQIVKQSKNEITLVKPTIEKETSMAISKKLTDLYRNIKGIEDESGIHDFYLGFPFLSGTLTDGTFFQAPLFLYPLRLEKNNVNSQKWVLKLEEGEPQINRTLFLAFKKLNNLTFTEDFYDQAAEIAANFSFEEWISFLKKYEMNVSFAPKGLTKLKEYNKEEEPAVGNLTLLENAIIGNFPQGGSSLVKDYEELILLSEESDLSLAGELIEPQDIEFDSELGDQERKVDTLEEVGILNLLQADGSQEEILKDARYKKGLVVHGPPGTGKSQVIVNLITDALKQDKKILVVCQKRAALDVVYQRLDGLGLSNHVALVHDEKNDRKKLYAKVGAVLEQNQVSFENALNQLTSTSNKLSSQENLLNSIAQALYSYQDFGLRLYDLYGLAKAVEDTTQIIELNEVLQSLNKDLLVDISEKVYTFAEWYERFGDDDFPLKDRKTFANFNMKEKLEVIELLNDVIEKARKAVEYIDTLDHEKITPGYTWLIENKLDKIYPDLEDGNKRTLQGLRLWWWTSVSGKNIIEELLEGEKFKGTSSSEWLKIKKSLIIMHQLGKVTKTMSEEIEKLKKYLNDSKVNDLKARVSEGDIPLSELDKMKEYIHRDFEELQQMDVYWNNCSDIEKKVILLLQKKTNKNESTLSDYWVELFKNSSYVHWIDQVEKKHPEVQKVSTNEFSRIRDSFANLIEDKRKLGGEFLIHTLTKKVESVQTSDSRNIRELKHQVGKKRQVWPLRRLVNKFAGNGLVDIMPVWLASPEIVSSIFPLKEGIFDLVIFDEASQCTVESGIPAVYRAKQVVIAGDEKQLPPFNMFQSSFVNEDDEEEEYDTDDSVSLLNLSKRRFPEKLLQWHYRSKYEELINYSNHAFYNGHVQIAPNVIPFKNPPAIKWKKVEGRWLNQSNEVEAIEVVNILKDILINQPGKTIGIITFNSKQQAKIQDFIDKRLNEDEQFSAVYNQMLTKDLDERVFIKNIENVQGDERDIILFSIGYAKNEEGKVYNRFGMLNQKGGENRLNVAVTRAKEGITVVSSIEPEELNVANTAQMGPKLLKAYLKYVRAVSYSQLDQIKAVIQEVNESVSTHVQARELHFDSPFEEQVYRQLRNLGYEVATQVGMSGYRIDLAIVHPQDSSRYILGIECDGAMYHSSANAKERDVYRQKFLESRGWTIDRIWSRNWWKNSSSEIERIDQKVKELLRVEGVREKVVK
ncbi:helicase [Bacillus sp. AFS076308]|uniref:AAA domain-containing protein n=1 Tax=unclassified Bacillus (in: firmicutes) TaxID=185979 RepID=UPI000BF8A0AE|nr:MULTISPECIES: AAA domain-containing protein [unclassified Bacillus (in: firmicutes)]PFO03368.1 helicase [Bacillus sp. AFS076308]PGV50049.1 helicase [Bacillus sp. AFS037270]